MDMTVQTNRKRLAELSFILWAGGAALLSYTLVYALRKPFTAATFSGLEFMGMDYKTAATVVQIAGYLLSKLAGIKLISELKRENRFRFIVTSVLLAEAALLVFAFAPQPYNIWALFVNGLSLGCMWGVIFSFLEGRRLSGVLGAIMGLSIAFSSGLAKSLGLFLMNDLGIDAFLMPAAIGLGASVLLIALAFALDRLPDPTADDVRQCTRREPMDGRQRKRIFWQFAPLLVFLFLGNLFITVVRDIKEDFLVNLIDTTRFSPWMISGVEGMVTLVILTVLLGISFIHDHQKVLNTILLLSIVGLLALVMVALNYENLQLEPLVWLFIQSLGLYVAYLSFQTVFFDRFVACYNIKGNVGFFIATIDFIGYLGTVGVLIFREFAADNLDWIEFYNTLVVVLGLLSCMVFACSGLAVVHYGKLRRRRSSSRPTVSVSVNS